VTYQERLRRKSSQHRKEKDRRSDAALASMHAAIARGLPRNQAIIEAKKRGARPQALADAMGLDRQSIRITVLKIPARTELTGSSQHPGRH